MQEHEVEGYERSFYAQTKNWGVVEMIDSDDQAFIQKELTKITNHIRDQLKSDLEYFPCDSLTQEATALALKEDQKNIELQRMRLLSTMIIGGDCMSASVDFEENLACEYLKACPQDKEIISRYIGLFIYSNCHDELEEGELPLPKDFNSIKENYKGNLAELISSCGLYADMCGGEWAHEYLEELIKLVK
jgi:hypothetical protein